MDLMGTNITHGDGETAEQYLGQLSLQSFRHRVPVVFYLLLIVALGVAGNVIVMIVFWTRFKPSATRVFVLAMAACDLFTNTIGIPLQIVTIRYAYDMFDYWICRGFFATATLSTQASGLLLVLVAFDRFRRVCRPFQKQINQTKALNLVLGVFCFSVLFFSPLVPLYGVHKVNTNEPGVQASMCWTEDYYEGTAYLLVYRIALGLIFFGGLLIMIMAYVSIGHRIWHRRKERRESSKRSKNSARMENIPESTDTLPVNSKDGILKRSSDAYPDRDNPRRCETKPATNVGFEHENPSWKNTAERSSESDGSLSDLNSSGLAGTACRPQSDDHPTQSTATRSSAEIPSVASAHQFPELADHLSNGQQEVSSPTPTANQTGCALFDPGDSGLNLKNTMASLDCQQEGKMPERAEQNEATGSTDNTQKESPPCVLKEVEEKPKGRARMLSTRRGPLVTSCTQRMRSRTTFMMFVLTMFYIINWLPHFVMRFTLKNPVNWCPNLTDCGLSSNAYAIIIRSYYLNSAVNAFVYGFCNGRFRQELKQLFSCTLRRKK